MRQIRGAGITAPVIGQEGYDSQKFIEIAGPAAEGVIITTSLDRDSSNPITQAFIKAFEDKAGYPTDMVAASGHTAVLVMAEALKKAGAGDRAALRGAIAESSVNASTGHISFNPLGEVKKDVQVQVVKDGAWRHYAVISDPVLVALIASIGLFIAAEEVYRLAFGPYGLSFTAPPLQTQVEILPGVFLSHARLMVVGLAVVIIGLLGWLSSSSRTGVAWRATVSDPEIAASFGIDIEKVRYLNFFIGSALAALAGVMVALLNNLVEPTMGAVPAYKELAIIVLGGLGSVRGTLVASLGLGVIESFGFVESITVLVMVIVGGIGSIWGVALVAGVLSVLPLFLQVVDDYKLLLYGALVFATMRFAPGGVAEIARRLRARAGR